MRGIGKRLPTPSTVAFLPSSFPYSTFSSGGGGRGRGRGLTPPLPNSPPPPQDPEEPEEPDSLPSLGHGRGSGSAEAPNPIFSSSSSSSSGRGQGTLSPTPQIPTPSSSDGGSHQPIFAPILSSSGRGRGTLSPPPQIPTPSSSDGGSHQSIFAPILSSSGRGGGRDTAPPQTPSIPDPTPKRPIFFSSEQTQFADPNETRSLGRGKASSASATPKTPEINRHALRRPPIGAPSSASQPGSVDNREDAIKKAVEVLSRGGGRGRGRGRGREMRGGREMTDDKDTELYLGDNADGVKFEKRMGEERMKIVEQVFEEVTSTVLPSPVEESYLDALHTNNMIEYEPEYLVAFDNPDIDEKPPMPLEEVLQKVKPFLMAYEGIRSQEEWEEKIKDLTERLPHMKALIDMYCGPDRVTAKQQMQELDRMAKTIPENIPSSVKSFTNRAVISLQSNPGWSWNKKYQFMDKLAREVSQHYK